MNTFAIKKTLLTQVAVDSLGSLKQDSERTAPFDHRAAVVSIVEWYWTFMLDHAQLYRLVNGVDGVPIDKTILGQSAQSLCKVVAAAVRPLLGENRPRPSGKRRRKLRRRRLPLWR